ncbi:MAG: flavoprotein oxygenase associated protein family [Betaproteobacteria bacterium]|jgi:flavin reductase (DIM6/NTAB) family NADH-FMN oxidoreductase RutF|nr:flavoprotein oxygenase associated protein family [Betaproteobacteria bacterium]
MTALVMPRPIGWMPTICASGARNLAPYSYFNLMGSDPFYVAFGSTGITDTLSNLREVPEFVVNTVTMHMLEQMNFTSGTFRAMRTSISGPASLRGRFQRCGRHEWERPRRIWNARWSRS